MQFENLPLGFVSDRLALQGRQWLPLALFCDAAVLARLRVGDVTGARAAFSRLSGATERDPRDLRTMLLNAHVSAAESALAR